MIGKRIRDERTRIGLSQEELGKQFSVTQQAVNKWESGKSSPDSEMIRKLADFFGCTADYLVGRTDTPFPVTVLAAHKTDGYDDKLTPEEQAAIRAFIHTYRSQFKKDKDE